MANNPYNSKYNKYVYPYGDVYYFDHTLTNAISALQTLMKAHEHKLESWQVLCAHINVISISKISVLQEPASTYEKNQLKEKLAASRKEIDKMMVTIEELVLKLYKL